MGLAACTISTSRGVQTPLPWPAQTAAATATAGATATSTPSLGTRTSDPIVITTDRMVYAPLDAVHVTITNDVQATSAAQSNVDNQVYVILAPPGRGCPGAQAERLQGSVWQEIRVCFPRGSGEANLGNGDIAVDPGETYAAGLAAHTDRSHPDQQDPFPTGLYRLAVHYYLLTPSANVARIDAGGGFTAYSQPFRVCTCGVCA